MTLAEYATFSNYANASATVVLALAFLAHVAEWGFARQVASETRRERELVTAGAPATAAPAEEDAPGDFRRDLAGRMGLSFSVLGTVVLWAAVVTRGLAAERVPWANMYEFSMAGVAVAMTTYLLLVRWQGVQWLGGLVTGFGVVVLGLSMTVYVPAGPIVPALHSYWLVIHVAAAMIAGSSFLVGAATSVLYLVRARAERNTPDEADRVGPIWRLPSAASMDRLAYRVHAFAFPIWTFGALIAGPIWAQYAWGRYWGWDPKEVWALITWVIYAAYLHARATAGWKGKAAAIIALVGFASFLVNYVGVNLFIDGLHSYAK